VSSFSLPEISKVQAKKMTINKPDVLAAAEKATLDHLARIGQKPNQKTQFLFLIPLSDCGYRVFANFWHHFLGSKPSILNLGGGWGVFQ
jgi:hypothetical protein